MKCKIMHESRGRLRVHMVLTRMTLHQADVAEYYLRALPAVTKVKVYDRTADAVIWFDGHRLKKHDDTTLIIFSRSICGADTFYQLRILILNGERCIMAYS